MFRCGAGRCYCAQIAELRFGHPFAVAAVGDADIERNPGTCLDTSTDFDVLLWEIPAATIRRPDAALFDCARTICGHCPLSI